MNSKTRWRSAAVGLAACSALVLGLPAGRSAAARSSVAAGVATGAGGGAANPAGGGYSSLGDGLAVTRVDDDSFVAYPVGMQPPERTLGGTGQGFLSFDAVSSLQPAALTIRIVESTNIRRYVPLLRVAAASLSAITGRPIRLDEAPIAARSATYGEMVVQTATSSPCGALNGGPRTSGVIGCGGPTTNGFGAIVSGNVWLQPDFYCSVSGAELVQHELGHAFGLAHFAETYQGLTQVMRSGVSGLPGYRAGDRRGIATIAGLAVPDEIDQQGQAAGATITVRPPTAVGQPTGVVAPAAISTGGSSTNAAASPSLATIAAAPVRVLDTRSALGAAGPIPSDGVRTLAIPQNLAGAPFDAVMLNLTVTGATGDGYLTVWPTGEAMPTASVINYRAGRDIANLTMVQVGAGQSLSIYNFGGPAHVLADFQGGFSPTGTAGYVPLNAARILDTRDSRTVPGESGNPLPCGGSTLVSSAITTAGVPGAAVGEVVTLTAVQTNGGGFVSATAGLFGYGNPPGVSNLNTVDDDVRPNLVVTPARGFYVRVSESMTSHVLVDLAGYFAAPATDPLAGRFVSTVPNRVLDTRIGLGLPGAFSAGQTRTLALPASPGIDPAQVRAVVVNLTVTAPTGAGYLTAFPAGAAQPNTSNANFAAGDTTAGLAIVKLGAGNALSLFTSAPTHVIADVMGYMLAP